MESSDPNLVCGNTGVMVPEATLLYEGHLACHWLIFICFLKSVHLYFTDFINYGNFSFPFNYTLVWKKPNRKRSTSRLYIVTLLI